MKVFEFNINKEIAVNFLTLIKIKIGNHILLNE